MSHDPHDESNADSRRTAGDASQHTSENASAAGDHRARGSQGSSSTGAPKSAGRRFLGGLGEIAFIVIGALIISSILRAFVAQMFIIPSGSMENTLQVNDRVLVSKVSTYHRGDIVVFTDPGGWLPDDGTPRTGAKKLLELVGLLPSTSNNHLIKRVIGLPGDDVKCCTVKGQITVNGTALDESAYLYSDASGTVQPAAVPFEVVVPAGRLFVLGDHRNASGDSRCHLADISTDGQPEGSNAFVPEANVVGPAIAIAAPLDRLRRLTVPDTFSAVPDPTSPAPAQAVIKPAGVGCT